ncbi:unnamed protein product [Mesocestoides corti]|uniref:Uncharacterized protein n=1 Tax=Mesocestoides corti TaxID=53468 RepID=A0A0R3UQX3_MESCO|nr:unnamed protein product [Mesocestoides corti]
MSLVVVVRVYNTSRQFLSETETISWGESRICECSSAPVKTASAPLSNSLNYTGLDWTGLVEEEADGESVMEGGRMRERGEGGKGDGDPCGKGE